MFVKKKSFSKYQDKTILMQLEESKMELSIATEDTVTMMMMLQNDVCADTVQPLGVTKQKSDELFISNNLYFFFS